MPEETAPKPAVSDQIIPRLIEEEMKTAYVNYAMSVIVGRALPDVRDGLKPVHRRILYAMHDLGMFHNKPFKKCARIVGECFVSGTLILTARGLLPIEQVEKGDFVYTSSGKQPVKELYEMPAKPLLKIILENGTSITSTHSQKFKVLTPEFKFEWKGADRLGTEDYLVIRAEYPNLTKYVSLGYYNGKEISLNENIAYLLGQLLSDGWVEKGCRRGYPFRCGWCSTSKEIITKLSIILQREFAYTPTIKEKHAKLNAENDLATLKRLYFIRVNNGILNRFLVSTFSLHTAIAKTKEIPPQVFTSPKKVIFSLVDGLIDGDGSVHAARNVIHYGSISEKLVDQLQLLLQHLGILSIKYLGTPQRAHPVLGRIVKSRNPFFNLEIRSRFAATLAGHLHVSDAVKAERLTNLQQDKTLKTSSFDEIPFAGKNIFAELQRKHLGAGWYADREGKKFRAGVKYKTGTKIRYSKDLWEKNLGRTQIQEWGISKKLRKIGSRLCLPVEDMLNNNLYFLKVSRTKSVPIQKTYDLGVEKQHEFLAQGIVSHNCLGKYHPHGDLAVYDSLVRMAQDFSLRYPLIKSQGNFGSVDGDSPAAQRYTEAKLNKLAEELLKDLDKETVDFRDNFDGSLKEPVVLPSKLPNLLINGSTGIAVGMATSIPPHNVTEVCTATIATIDNPEISVEELMQIIPGPDFPTGAEVICGPSLHYAYAKGKGKVTIKSVAVIEEDQIIITEIPYMINKAEMIEQIAELVKDKRIVGIRNINDESDREGIRVVVDLKKDVDPNFILNQLYEYSNLRVSFSIALLALVNNEPKVMGLKEFIQHHIAHRQEVITRRTKYDLNEAEKKVHILNGLLIALARLDEVIPGIRNSRTVEDAQNFLINTLSLTEIQAKAILELRLQKLASLEQEKIKEEHISLLERIIYYQSILASTQKILELIKEELKEIITNYGDARRSKIVHGNDDEYIDWETLIEEERVIVTMTNSGYVKRLPLDTYRTQKRGGKGMKATEMKDEDFVEKVYVASTHDYLLIFTDKGQLYWLKVYNIPEGSRQAKGKHIANVLEMEQGEKITAIVPVRSFTEGYLFMATKQGTVKKTELKEFSNPRKGGIRAINLDETDTLVGVKYTTGNNEIILATKYGQANRFNEEDVRNMGRTAGGVRGIRLDTEDEVIGMLAADEGKEILTLTEKGYGKRTPVSEYRLCNRGGKGVTNIKITDKNGAVKVVMLVDGSEDLMIMSKNGIAIRMKCTDISVVGRATQGVRVIKLSENDQLVAAAQMIGEENGNGTENIIENSGGNHLEEINPELSEAEPIPDATPTEPTAEPDSEPPAE